MTKRTSVRQSAQTLTVHESSDCEVSVNAIPVRNFTIRVTAQDIQRAHGPENPLIVAMKRLRADCSPMHARLIWFWLPERDLRASLRRLWERCQGRRPSALVTGRWYQWAAMLDEATFRALCDWSEGRRIEPFTAKFRAQAVDANDYV